MKTFLKLFALCFLVTVLTNCTQKETEIYKYEDFALNLPNTPYDYADQGLSKVSTQANLSNLVRQRVSDQGATLGRVLFYDKALSINSKVSCSSCHLQKKGFADDKALSIGFDGRSTSRNASAISNVVLNNSLFWDGRESSLREMVLQPIKNHIEMGMDNFDVLEKKLAKFPYYKQLFKDAFGTEEITKERIAQGLEQFLSSIATVNNKRNLIDDPNSWDNDVPIPPSFSANEKLGAQIYFGKGKCAQCHESNFFFEGAVNIGLDKEPKDSGIGAFGGIKGAFTIPKLNNISLTAPYMHDGRFSSLKEVINHYSEGIQDDPGLTWVLRDFEGKPNPFRFTEKEKIALEDFLKTFTDNKFLEDPKFSDPFK
jgi:cytochrome c peroxidase